MASPAPESNIRRLVDGFEDSPTTEELILFVAGTDNLLDFCHDLLDQYDRDPQAPLVRELNSLCMARGILPGDLYAEVRKVLLALNRFHDAGGDHYATLGLGRDASPDEVKRAFRTLSKQYHPDRQAGSDGNAERFMEIAGAYHALMTAARTRRTPGPAGPWRHSRRTPGRSDRHRDRRKFLIGLGMTITLLAGVSIYLAGRYHDRAKAGRVQQARQYQARPATDTSPAETPSSLAEVLVRAAREGRNHVQVEPIRRVEQEAPPPTATVSKSSPPAPPPPRSRPMPVPDLVRPEDLRPAATRLQKHAEPAAPVRVAKAAPADPPASGEETTKREDLDQQAHARKIDTINTSLEISALVKEFCALYNHRDLTPFLTLFSDRATENGKPLTEMADQYRSLFAHTRAIDLTVADIDWHPTTDKTYLARGNFTVAYTYSDNRTRTHTGTISFDLVRRHDTLKIQALNYTFN